MKNLRQLCMAVVLTCMLAIPVFAGQIQTPVADPPPPETVDGQMQTPVAGQIETPNNVASNSVTEIALSLLQNLLPLF